MYDTNPKPYGAVNPRPVRPSGNVQSRPVQKQNVQPSSRGVLSRDPNRIMPGTPPVGRPRTPSNPYNQQHGRQSQGIKTIEDFCNMIRNVVSNFAIIDDNVYKQNLAMAHGKNFSEKDRAVSLECASYLMSHAALLCMGLVFDQKFKQSFIDAISVEMYIDDADDAEKKRVRSTITAKDTYKSPYAGMVIGLTTFVPAISQELLKQLNQSFDNVKGCAGEFNAAVAKLTRDQRIQYGFIFSNFMYLIRAFMQNDAFMGYVAAVLDRVQAIIMAS